MPNNLVTPGTEIALLVDMTMKLFDHWQLSNNEKLSLLCVQSTDTYLLAQLTGGHLESLQSESLNRIVHLIDIHAKLKTIFPQNIELAYKWITQPNKAFGSVTPIKLIETHGEEGITTIQSYLNTNLI